MEKRYENAEKQIFDGIGKYDIPMIEPIVVTEECEFIGFNYASGCKDRHDKGVHFFIDDYQFERLWRNIDGYVNMLAQFKYVCSPDFSIYTDFPKALQIYNHYRKHWVAAYLQGFGCNVVPTIAWSDKESFEWCFDGEPVGGTVAVSSVGTQRNAECKQRFLEGYEAMCKRLRPANIIFFGNVPPECTGNIIKMPTFVERLRKVKCDGR